MKEVGRTLDPINISDISKRLSDDRKHLLDLVEKAIGVTISFAQEAAIAIGDISYEEAKQGVIDCFRNEMRKTT